MPSREVIPREFNAESNLSRHLVENSVGPPAGFKDDLGIFAGVIHVEVIAKDNSARRARRWRLRRGKGTGYVECSHKKGKHSAHENPPRIYSKHSNFPRLL